MLRATRALPLLRLAVFGGRGSGGALTLLRRSRLGQLALISVLVILLGAAAGLLLESGAPESTIVDFGDALWWSGALATTVGSELYPVTAAGRVLGFSRMLYAVGILSYFIASVLVGLDFPAAGREARNGAGDIRLDAEEKAALRRILDRPIRYGTMNLSTVACRTTRMDMTIVSMIAHFRTSRSRLPSCP